MSTMLEILLIDGGKTVKTRCIILDKVFFRKSSKTASNVIIGQLKTASFVG